MVTDWLVEGTSGQCVWEELIAVKELLLKEGRVRADKRHRHRHARETHTDTERSESTQTQRGVRARCLHAHCKVTKLELWLSWFARGLPGHLHPHLHLGLHYAARTDLGNS